MYTAKEYSQMAITANEQGKLLYVMVDKETNDETLVIAEAGYYVTEPNSNRTYGEINKEFDDIKIAEAKENKINMALIQAKVAIAEGYVKLADGIEIETNSSTVADLNNALLVMKAQGLETYTWIDRNDCAVELSEAEMTDIIVQIGLIKSYIWSTYHTILAQINKAQTVEEINAIEIDYSIKEEVVEEIDEDDFDEEEFIEEEI
jgi:hypothetical protein